jgi:hypothetical protein
MAALIDVCSLCTRSIASHFVFHLVAPQYINLHTGKKPGNNSTHAKSSILERLLTIWHGLHPQQDVPKGRVPFKDTQHPIDCPHCLLNQSGFVKNVLHHQLHAVS